MDSTNGMDINSFLKQYKVDPDFDSNAFFEKAKKDREIDALLGTTITAGVTLGDYLIGDGLGDQMSDELYQGFKGLMGDKINSYSDVRDILVEKVELGENSVFGLINKIKGQLGENQFLKEAQEAGVNASLAESGSQEAWDVAIENSGEMQFVQVKLYSDPDAILNEITKVNDKITEGNLLFNDTPITQIDFAVPENIYEQVAEGVAEKGLDVEILKFGMTAEEGKDIVMGGIENLEMDGLFGDMFGAAVPTLVLHSMVNAFLVYKGAKEVDSFLSDTALQTTISTIGVGSGMVAERLLQKLSFAGGLPTMLLVTSVSMATRAIITRIVNRNDYVNWLSEENLKSRELVRSFE